MKGRFLSFWIFCFVLLGVIGVEAQYQRGGYPQYGRQSSIVPQANDPKPEPKPLTAEEIVEKQMPKITEAAELNDFEQAVVSSILTKYFQQTIELQILELDSHTTKEKLEQIRKNQEAELKAGLPEEKFNVIMDIQEKGFKKAKKKKKKKKNKED